MIGSLATIPRTSFQLPRELAASEPPEARGIARDQVRLLVARPQNLTHVRFRQLGTALSPGDLLIVNTSATRAAAAEGTRSHGGSVVVHFSTKLDDGTWVVEFRTDKGAAPLAGMEPPETVFLAGGMTLQVLNAHPDPAQLAPRLWRARAGAPVEPYLALHGRPITYEYVRGRWPLSAYQTVFAREQASAEMPSAARPFTHELVTDLVTRGVNFTTITLHCGVSSQEAGEPPQSESFRVSPAAAWLINATRAAGHRVIAVGTTATRAVETVAREDGTVVPGAGWTDTVLGAGRPARAVDGLITGWHHPGASHLGLLEAVAGPSLVQRAYDAALDARYLWHEFGDSCLLLPGEGLRASEEP